MKIYVLGDSISVHYGPYLERLLKGEAEYSRKKGEEEALADTDDPQGANAGDSSMVLSFLKAKAASGGIDADLLLVNCGLHDIKTDPKTGNKQVPINEYTANVRAIVQTAVKMGLEPIWIRTTPVNDAVHNHDGMSFHRFSADCEAYNRAADDIMTEANVPVIDLHSFSLGLGEDLYCDHVHFHEHIREKQAGFIAEWLNDFMQKRSD